MLPCIPAMRAEAPPWQPTTSSTPTTPLMSSTKRARSRSPTKLRKKTKESENRKSLESQDAGATSGDNLEVTAKAFNWVAGAVRILQRDMQTVLSRLASLEDSTDKERTVKETHNVSTDYDDKMEISPEKKQKEEFDENEMHCVPVVSPMTTLAMSTREEDVVARIAKLEKATKDGALLWSALRACICEKIEKDINELQQHVKELEEQELPSGQTGALTVEVWEKMQKAMNKDMMDRIGTRLDKTEQKIDAKVEKESKERKADVRRLGDKFKEMERQITYLMQQEESERVDEKCTEDLLKYLQRKVEDDIPMRIEELQTRIEDVEKRADDGDDIDSG